MSKEVLELTNIHKSYIQGEDEIKVLDNISFNIKQGEMVSIVGSSGSGKSTLLHISGLLDEPNSGQIRMEGSNVETNKMDILRLKYIGFIYQFHHLLNDFTVFENIAMPALILGKGPNNVKHLMQELGVLDKAQSYPSQLSGGQQQRVAIARALTNNPKLVIADEPTGNLDNKNATMVFELMKSLAKSTNTAFLIATHNLNLAEQSHRVYKLHEQKLYQVK